MPKQIEELSPAELAKLRKPISKKVGKQLRKIRKQKGLSQEELAHKAGLYRTYVGHIETGARLPNVFTLWRLAKVMKVDLGDLLKGL